MDRINLKSGEGLAISWQALPIECMGESEREIERCFVRNRELCKGLGV